MKVLLVYPRYPDTFWGFKHALKIASKKASFPPLGLLTVASMLPPDWEKQLVDMNITRLKDKDIKQTDMVFISAMAVQSESAREVIDRCKKLGIGTVAGGPLFTTEYNSFDDVNHLILDEAEHTLPPFLQDLEKGCARHIYSSSERPDICQTPLPMWSLIDMNKYSSMNIQYSRGCPYNCEFCDIIVLNGHKVRTKSTKQMIAELEAIYNLGWQQGIFIVDDNFIGNKKKLKAEILPAIISWQKANKYPFSFHTEASINMADDEKLMKLMVDAGFDRVFIGIETPNEESLNECNKYNNVNRDLVASVKKIQNYGFEVQGGFIIGFDSDPISIFKSQINFIQQTGIVTAMVGLLNAPRGTRLYKRLSKEGRILKGFTGNNVDCSMNFIPKMNYDTLINGYKYILNSIYAPKQYYERIKTFFGQYHPQRSKGKVSRFRLADLRAAIKCIWLMGVIGKGRRYFWKLIAYVMFRRPGLLPQSIVLSVYGYHFRKIVERIVTAPVTKPESPAAS